MEPTHISSPAKFVLKSAITNPNVESKFLKALNAPFKPYPFDQHPRTLKPHPFERHPRTIPYSQFPNGQHKPLFSASGDWEFLNRTDIEVFDEKIISRTTHYTTAIRRGMAGDREISCLVKSWKYSIDTSPVSSNMGMFKELFLYMKRLDELSGSLVPKLIAVQRSPDELHFVMELPHHSFWIEASSDMPEILKERVVKAMERIHSEGILLNQPVLSDFLIAGDGTVFVINFDQSRSNQPVHSPCIWLDFAHPHEFVAEMDLLRFRLNYRGSRLSEEEGRYLVNAVRNIDVGVNPHPETPSFIALNNPPERFIVPGQSEQSFQQSLKSFMETLLKLAKGSPQQPQVGTLHLTNSSMSGRHVTSTETQQPHRYNLRKRKQTCHSDTAIANNAPRKRARVRPQDKPQLKRRKHDKKKLAASLTSKPYVDFSVQLNNITPGLPFIVIRDFASKKPTNGAANSVSDVCPTPSIPNEPFGDALSRSLEQNATPRSLRLTNSIWTNAGSFLKEPFRLVGGVLNGFVGLGT